MPKKKTSGPTPIASVKHKDTRKNIPTEELRDFVATDEQAPKAVLYPRNPDLDPQLVWKGKDEQDAKPLEVPIVPIYIQEKIHPQAIIEDFRQSAAAQKPADPQANLFADFNGLPAEFDQRVDFYHHDGHWSNRMILGDSLLVMSSLAEKEGLKGKVQMIYLDPPYGIKFGSNWQVSTRKRDVKDGKAEDLTRQPEQIKAFRDTYELGIHSYLAYLRDRLAVARELLTESGSIFVQIGDENVHLVRCLLDEVFGAENFVVTISFQKTGSISGDLIEPINNYILWFTKDKKRVKFRPPYVPRDLTDATEEGFNPPEAGTDEASMASHGGDGDVRIPKGANYFRLDPVTSDGYRETSTVPFMFCGTSLRPGNRSNWEKNHWKTGLDGMNRLSMADRLAARGGSIAYKRYLSDFPVKVISNHWADTGGAREMVYVVQTNTKVIERCLLMSTDAGDLVLDSTCGSGTTAYVAEQWGRRWITTDTSRVALALARTRIMAARYPYYILADSPEGIAKEAELSGKWSVAGGQPSPKTEGDPRKGFVYKRVPHVTLKAIANNEEIDVIHARWQQQLEPLRAKLNGLLKQKWEEWEVPRATDDKWPAEAKTIHGQYWDGRRERQKEIDASIARKAEMETLYDQPYEENKKVRVSGPFTVESLSPHRTLSVTEKVKRANVPDDNNRVVKVYGTNDFGQMILDNLRAAGVQNTRKAERLKFDSIAPYAGQWVHGEGKYTDADGKQKRAAICIGPEHGTVGPELIKEAAKEAVQGVGFDLLIVCGFAFDPHVSEESKRYGKLVVLPTRINPDLAMGELLKKTGAGNLFMVFGEPDIMVASEEWLVDSSGKRVAPHEIFKLISGLDGLAEINRLSSEDLRDYAELSVRREIWDHIANAAGGNLNSGQHRGGTGPSEHGGVSSLAWHCAGVAGGAGNVFDFIRTIRASAQPGVRKFAEGLRRDKQDAKRPDQITIHPPLTTRHCVQVSIHGLDVYDPTTGEIRASTTDDIACWFIDTDYNGESFFVRHAYFTGAGEPYEKLKRALRAEIDEAAWSALYSTVSRPFDKPATGKIAIKVINHYGDEVLKVCRV